MLVGLREVVVVEGEPLEQLDRRATERDTESEDAHGGRYRSAAMAARRARDLRESAVGPDRAPIGTGPGRERDHRRGRRPGGPPHRGPRRRRRPRRRPHGVTAVFPHDGRALAGPVYAATHILNGYGELIGVNAIREWGILESPIVLTSSLLIGKAYDATVRWIAARDRDAGEDVMPCVTECDDSLLSAVLAPLADEDVWAALDGAADGAVEEGCVGSGTGMQCFDFKGGIGTASRVSRRRVHGRRARDDEPRRPRAPAGRRGPRGRGARRRSMPEEHHDGSCIVRGRDGRPLLPHQLRRVAERAGMGLARGGSHAANTSGEQMLAFSTGEPPSVASEATARARGRPTGRAGTARAVARCSAPRWRRPRRPW